MSELKKFYVKEVGHEYDRIESSSWYLAELALHGAIEIDNHILGRNHDFCHIQELAEILGKYQLKDTDTALTEPNFPYLPFWRAFRKNSEKDIRWLSELALEMRLLRPELNDISNSKRLEELRNLLCSLSSELSNWQWQNNYPLRLAA